MFQPPTSFLLFRLLPPSHWTSHWIPGKCHQIPPIYVTIFARFIPMNNHHVLVKSHWTTSKKQVTSALSPGQRWGWYHRRGRRSPRSWNLTWNKGKSDRVGLGTTPKIGEISFNHQCCCLLLKSHGFPSFLGGCHPFFPMKSPYFSQLPVSAGASRVGDPSIRPWQQLAGLGLRAQWCECWGITPINGDLMVIEWWFNADLGFPRIFLARNHRKIWEHLLNYGDLMVI